jgi:hypothetical protein
MDPNTWYCCRCELRPVTTEDALSILRYGLCSSCRRDWFRNYADDSFDEFLEEASEEYVFLGEAA